MRSALHFKIKRLNNTSKIALYINRAPHTPRPRAILAQLYIGTYCLAYYIYIYMCVQRHIQMNYYYKPNLCINNNAVQYIVVFLCLIYTCRIAPQHLAVVVGVVLPHFGSATFFVVFAQIIIEAANKSMSSTISILLHTPSLQCFCLSRLYLMFTLNTRSRQIEPRQRRDDITSGAGALIRIPRSLAK